MFRLLFHPTEAIRWDLPHQQQPVIATRLANPLATQANPFSQLSLLLAPEGLPPWLGSQFPPPFLGTLPLNYHCPSGPSTTLLFPHLTPIPNLHSSYWHLQMLSLYIKKKKKKIFNLTSASSYHVSPFPSQPKFSAKLSSFLHLPLIPQPILKVSFASIPPSTIKQPLLQLPMISCHQIQKTFFKSGLILLAFSRSFNTADFSPLKTLFLASYCAVVLPSLWSYLFCLALGFGPSPLLPYSLPNMVAAAVTSNMPITPKLIAQPFPPL